MQAGVAADPGAVLVTGAAGHLGANLVRALLARGRPVRALVHRQTQALEGLPVEMVRADILDRASVTVACRGLKTVFHLAATVSAGWAKPSRVEAVNLRGTENVVEACLTAGVRRLVHFSSVQALVAQGPDALLHEGCRLLERGRDRCGAYDLSKAAAERVVLGAAARGLDATILNPTAVLGPFDFQPSPMGEVLRGLAQGRFPAMVSGGACDFVDARDVAAAALSAESKGQPGQRYLLSGTRLSLVELAGRWAAATGRHAPRMAVPMPIARLVAPLAAGYARLRGRRPLFTGESLRILRTLPRVAHDKASAELDYAPRPIAESLRDTWEWIKGQGWP